MEELIVQLLLHGGVGWRWDLLTLIHQWNSRTVLQSAAGAAPIWKTLEMTDIPGAAYRLLVVLLRQQILPRFQGFYNAIDGIVLVYCDRVLVKDQTASE
jgi:hypothetical protein